MKSVKNIYSSNAYAFLTIKSFALEDENTYIPGDNDNFEKWCMKLLSEISMISRKFTPFLFNKGY